MTEETWHPVQFTENESDFIYERVRDIGLRLQEIPQVFKTSQISKQQSGYKKWTPSYLLGGLAQGPLGLALMYSEFDHVWPEEGWDKIAHKYLVEIQSNFSISADSTLGLLSGACGFLFVIQQLSRGGTRYRKVHDQLKTAIFPAVLRYTENLVLDEYPHSGNYNLVSGAVGIGVTLQMLGSGSDSSETDVSFQLLQHLVWLGKQGTTKYMDQFAMWYHSPHLHARQLRWQVKDNAYVGYGMRHGLAGLIALLSLVLRDGLDTDIDDTAETLESLCNQTVRGIHRDEQGWCWPQDIVTDLYHSSGVCAPFAWCNGIAGIARALWLAGHALHNSKLCDLALESIADMGQRYRKERPLIGPSLCHGLAGMIQVSSHFANETRDSTLSDDLRAMISHLLDLFEADRPFGYRAFGPEYIRFDSPWFFEGAAGVALALLAIVSPEPPSWDRVMLLA